jgi:hypothetical protein
LREERRLRVFANSVLKNIFGPKRDKVTGSAENYIHDVCSSQYITQFIKSRRMIWGVHVAHIGERRGIYRVSVGKHDGKRPLGSHRSRYE